MAVVLRHAEEVGVKRKPKSRDEIPLLEASSKSAQCSPLSRRTVNEFPSISSELFYSLKKHGDHARINLNELKQVLRINKDWWTLQDSNL